MMHLLHMDALYMPLGNVCFVRTFVLHIVQVQEDLVPLEIDCDV
jgi:hypothetical protein